MNEFERACDSMSLKINVGKSRSKMLVVKKDERGSCKRVCVMEEEMQKVDKFNYLGMMIGTGGGMGEEVAHRVLE